MYLSRLNQDHPFYAELEELCRKYDVTPEIEDSHGINNLIDSVHPPDMNVSFFINECISLEGNSPNCCGCGCGGTTRGNAPWGTYPGEDFTYSIILSEVGKEKFKVYKKIRELLGCNVQTATLVLRQLPFKLFINQSKYEAEYIKKEFESAGAKIELVKDGEQDLREINITGYPIAYIAK